MKTRLFYSAALLLALAGCHPGTRPPAPLPPPGVETQTAHFVGSTLSGALPQPLAGVAEAGAWVVEIRVDALRALPVADGYEPIGPKARLVLSDGSGDLIRPSARLVYSTRYRVPDDASFDAGALLGDASASFDLGLHTGGVAEGSTFSIDVARTADLAPLAGRQRVSVQLFRTPGVTGYDVALVSDDRVAPPAAGPVKRNDDEDAPPPKPSVPPKDVRETIVVRREPTTDTDRLLLAVPMPLEGTPYAGLLFDITVRTKPDANDAALAVMRTDLAAASTDAAARAARTPPAPAERLTAAALDALTAAGDAPQAALVYLAHQSGADLAEAVALVADEKVLALIAKAVREQALRLPVRDPASVAWLLDRVTIRTVASVNDDESAASSMSAVKGVLAAYAGEAGRQLDLLQSLANESAGSADLRNRLIAEHLIYLEDNAPGVRVRAYDWLRARDLAPAGYDPLADAKTRHAALEKSREPATTTKP